MTKTAQRLTAVSREANKTPTTKVLPAQLLYSREQAAAILGGISVASVMRLEAEGVLTAIKLSRKPTAMTFYKVAQVHALAGEEA
jgi:hypothetical protein